MNARYTTLPVIAMLFKVAAFVVLVAGICGVISILAAGFPATPDASPFARIWGPVLLAIHSLGWTLLKFLILFAISELIHVALDIEENTRRTAELAAGRREGTTPRA